MGVFGHGGLLSKGKRTIKSTLSKANNGLDKGVFQQIDKAIEKVGTNVGEFINNATGVTASAKQQYEYNKDLQNMAQDYNAKQAEIERNWQAEMSNTARQRGVEDLTKAGLNPVLSAGEGAWSGAGAAAVSPGGSTGAGTNSGNVIDMLATLIDAQNKTARTQTEIKKMKHEIGKIDAEKGNITKNTENGGTGGTAFSRTWNWLTGGNSTSARQERNKKIEHYNKEQEKHGWKFWKYKEYEG